MRRVRPVYRARRDRLLAALGSHLPEIRPNGEAAGLHLLLRLPAELDPDVVSTAAAMHGVSWKKRRGTGPTGRRAAQALLIGYGSIREGDLARGIESLRVLI